MLHGKSSPRLGLCESFHLVFFMLLRCSMLTRFTLYICNLKKRGSEIAIASFSSFLSFPVVESARRLFFQNVIASCKWDSECAKVIFGGNNALNLTYFWPKNLNRINDERDSQDGLPPTNTDGNYLTSAAKLLLSTELDFCPGSIISSQVCISLSNSFVYCRDECVRTLRCDSLNFVVLLISAL